MKLDNTKLDPTGSYTTETAQYIMEACGILPYWVASWPQLGTLLEHLNQQYGFGIYEMTGGTLSDDGIYQYPEDPPLAPLISIQTMNGVFYQYLYGIVAIPMEDGAHFVTRMD